MSTKFDSQELIEDRNFENAEGASDMETDNAEWEIPSLLAAPAPNPDMAQCWVRAKCAGKDDFQNVARHLQMGYRPRSASTCPPDFYAPRVSFGDYGDVIGNSDSILMEIPIKKARAYRKRENALTNAHISSVAGILSSKIPQSQYGGASPGEVQRQVVKGRSPIIAADQEGK